MLLFKLQIAEILKDTINSLSTISHVIFGIHREMGKEKERTTFKVRIKRSDIPKGIALYQGLKFVVKSQAHTQQFCMVDINLIHIQLKSEHGSQI